MYIIRHVSSYKLPVGVGTEQKKERTRKKEERNKSKQKNKTKQKWHAGKNRNGGKKMNPFSPYSSSY